MRLQRLHRELRLKLRLLNKEYFKTRICCDIFGFSIRSLNLKWRIL